MPLCVFDLDNTLTYDRTIERVADRLGRKDVLEEDRLEPRLPEEGGETSRRLMVRFANEDADEFEEACRAFRIREGAAEAVAGLRNLGFRIGVVSAFYQPAVDRARQELGLDFALAGEPEVVAGRLTGRLRDSTYTARCGNLVCNEQVLRAFCGGDDLTVGVSAGYDDRCLLHAADLGIAVEPCPIDVRVRADVVVRHLAAIPAVVKQRMTQPTPLR